MASCCYAYTGDSDRDVNGSVLVWSIVDLDQFFDSATRTINVKMVLDPKPVPYMRRV